jgi:hypothetical protein
MERLSVLLLGALAGSLIGGAVTGLVYSRVGSEKIIGPLSVFQPDSEYVWTFNGSLFKEPANRKAFVQALSNDRVSFRRNMVIKKSDTDCNSTELPDVGGILTAHEDPCSPELKMGQQVTQRVGLHNRANLEIALSYVTPTPTPTPPPQK